MNRAAAIRAFVKANGPCSFDAIAAAFGASTREARLPLHGTLAQLCRDGLIAKSGQLRRQRYAFVREPDPRPKFTPAEMRIRRKEQEVARRRARGCKPREEYLAGEQKAAAERKAARQRARRAPKPAPRAPRAAAPKRLPHQEFSVTPAAPRLEQPTPEPPRLESSEQWMARTGRKPEVLPPPLSVKPWEPLPKIRRKRAA